MDSIYEIGLQIILWLQGLGDWLLVPMQAITFLGNEEFYLLVAPALVWCVDMTLGLRTGLFLMINGGLNTIIKLAFHTPRPYWYTQNVAGITHETSFSFPSGHAQNAAVVWGSLAHGLRRRWAWIAAVVITLLIGISRSALGVHFPHDVVGGWLIGMVILWVMLRLEVPVLAWLKRHSLRSQIVAVFIASLALILLGAATTLSMVNWSLPDTWITNATLAFPYEPTIDPAALSGLVSNAGAFFGLALGALWLEQRGSMSTRGTSTQYLVRYLIGIAGVFLLWYGIGLVFPRGEALIPYILRYLRYALVGVWITALAPMLFIRFGLAQKKA